MRVLFDTNIVLDFLLERGTFLPDALALFTAHDQKKIDAFVSAITPVNVFYIIRKEAGLQKAVEAVAAILDTLDVCFLDKRILEDATQLPVTDYEDAVQVASALSSRLDCIVTRDLKDYKNSPLPVYSPSDFIALLSATNQ